MTAERRLLMLGAMYENGGNATHRFLDGHPELLVYPFESQLGTRHVRDALSSMFPQKYRWPEFRLGANAAEDFRSIIDEETKVRARTPHVSKFRNRPFTMDDDERLALYEQHVASTGRSRAANVMAFFAATFDAWRDCRRSGRETLYVGYSPIVVIDADKILEDLPTAHFLHVARNPWSGYADTKKRPVPLPLADYLLGWTLNQHFALLHRERYPDRMHIVRAEDVMADSVAALTPICRALDIEVDDALARPSWNGAPLEQIRPWGTIRSATDQANRATAELLSAEEREDVGRRAWPYLEAFGYDRFWG